MVLGFLKSTYAFNSLVKEEDTKNKVFFVVTLCNYSIKHFFHKSCVFFKCLFYRTLHDYTFQFTTWTCACVNSFNFKKWKSDSFQMDVFPNLWWLKWYWCADPVDLHSTKPYLTRPLFKTLVGVMHAWNMRVYLVQHSNEIEDKGRAAFAEQWKWHMTLRISTVIHSLQVLIPGNDPNYVHLLVNYQLNDAF